MFIWASIDYNRFIKFWMVRTAPYSLLVRSVFRLFFLAVAVGSLSRFIGDVSKSRHSTKLYGMVLLFSILLFAAFILMINLVEWMNSKRISKR